MLNLCKCNLKRSINLTKSNWNLNYRSDLKNNLFVYFSKFTFAAGAGGAAQAQTSQKKAGKEIKENKEVKENLQSSSSATQIPQYKPFEQLEKSEVANKLRDERKESYFYYGSEKRHMQSKTFNKTEFLAKKLRQMWIRSGDFDSHKHSLQIKRLRTKEDGLFQLLKQGEIAGIIEGREEFPDINFVMDKQLVKHFDGLPHANVKPFYLQNGNEEIRCTLIKKERLPIHNKPFKVRFQRYIVGRPNLLNLNIKIIGRHLHPLLRDMDVEIAQYYFDIDVWCVNDDYPPLLEIDVRLISPDKPFKFLDLHLMMPEGMWLHRKYDNLMYNSIASMGENFNMILSSTLYPFDDPDNVGEAGAEDTELSGEMKEMVDFMEKTQGPQDKKKKKFTMPFNVASSKKLMQAKNEGADQKALRKLMSKPASDKKTAGKKK